MKKPEIIVIIATKDRVGFLEQSLKCVKNHSHEPNYLVVTSDSQDKNTQNRERELCEEFGAKFIQNRRTKECYAGNLNSAIDHILSHYAFNLHRERSPEACFVAFLDDDDLWQADYLQSCVNALQDDTDFVVSGLIYKKNGKSEKLDIPKKLGVKSFLTKNPHIQGSNTFIRLSTLLKAGCFDENLRSMTDRDLFTRVMMLNPKYTILNEHLVEIDASKSRKRLTTDLDKKRESMAKFYAKYGGLMDKREEGQFFANAKERFGIKLDKKAIVKILADKPFEYKKEANCKINDRVIFAFVTGEEEYARRIIKNIKEQPLTHKKIVCVDNTGVKAAQKLLKDSAIPASVLNNDEIEKLSKRCKDEGLHFVDHELFKNGKIRSIAHARSLLHLFAYLESEDGDVIWILDDDMEFAQNYLIDGKPTQIPLDISRVIAHCKKEQYDVMIGSYSKDAPLPTLSTLRCSLLDCLYATKLSKNALMDQKLWRKRDYYYGLSMESFNHLESPFVAYEKPKLDDIFSGKATTRELFSKPFEVSKDLYSRGGNTLVFNRKTLEVPNISPTINGQSMRRSDYFWVCQLKNLNYKVVSSTFSTLHNRKTEEIFDYYKESQKLLFDLVGSAFTHKYKQDDTREEFYKNFQEAYFNRLVLIIADYYRIMGIREILGLKDERLESFNLENLHKFIKQAKEIAEESSTKVSFSHIHSKVKLYQHYLHNVSQYRELLNATFRCGELEFLGIGEEGIVFNDGEMVYKVFHETLNKETCKLLEYFNNCIDENKGFFKFKIKSLEKRTIIYYKAPNLKNCQKYVGGHALEVASMLAFLRSKGLILKNIKKENFIIIDHQLKFIDYGKDIEYFSIDLFQKSIERAYQMLKFSNLNALEFKILIKRTYQGDHNFNFGIENFLPLLSETYKEQTHDPIIIELIRQLRPDRLLDYGAGKCKIANALSCEMEVFVFDVNAEQVKERANKSLKIVENIKNINEKFNLINCNLVLCCVEQKTVEDILGKIYNLLNDDGYLILSICNPFFDDINQSQTRICGYHDDYSICSEYTKKTNFINRIEYHRPFAFYENKLKQYGFELLEIREDCGVEIESLEGISEHLILVCKKRERVVLEDCSLLIKTNSMDHESVYKSVVHIFEQLEKDSRFSERIVVVDSEKEERSRAYTSNNRESLLGELRKLKNEGYIDRIIEAQEQNNAIYQRFFACDSHFAHAKNSQPLLATLTGIAAVQTRYVFQTDLDILYFNHAKNSVQNAFDMLKKYNATTLSLSICHSTSTKPLMGTRVEVRSCFMDTQKLNALLPLRNPTENGIFTLPWHRALDRMLAHEDSLRLHQNGLFFIHPQNQLKNGNLISVARTALERGYFPDIQQNKVDLAGDLGEWTQKSYASMIIFIRGKDTPPKKLRRLFNSLKMQNYQDFEIVYIDDSSILHTSEYLKMLVDYDAYFKGRFILVLNDHRVGSLENFEIMHKHIVKNPQAIIVNLDSDDCLLVRHALERIKYEFDHGADVTVGNLFRVDKPLKKYTIESFQCPWNGEHIWLHPKCFRKYLTHYIQDDTKMEGKYIDIATDFAMMLPILCHAKHPKFIEEQLYYFEPSKENQSKKENQRHMKKELLKRAKEASEHKIIAVIGAGNATEESNEYKLAYTLGKALVDAGYRVQTGGLGGVMEAALKGARDSKKYKKGDTIAIIPSLDENEVNDYADIVIPTGLDVLRNAKVIQASAVVAIGGGAGTLSEIALAWQYFKLIIAYRTCEGWSSKLADKRLDDKVRYDAIREDKIYGVNSADEALEIIKARIDKYTRIHHVIKWRNRQTS